MKKAGKISRLWFVLFLLCLGLSSQMAVRGEEQFAVPQILYPPADGNHGYYRTLPQIRILHKEEKAALLYLLRSGEEKLAEGKLERQGKNTAETVLDTSFFKEGSNTLEVWMKQGERQIFYKRMEFLIDTSPPEDVRFTYENGSSVHSLIFNTGYMLGVKSRDAVSGVEAIYYKTGGTQTRAVGGGEGQIEIQPCFWGRIEAYAVDYAGNQSTWQACREILCENLAPEINIQIKEQEAVDGKRSAGISIKVRDGDPSAGIRKFVCRTGERVIVRKETAAGNAKKTEMDAAFTVKEGADGKGVHVSVEVWDHAGNYNIRSETILEKKQTNVRLQTKKREEEQKKTEEKEGKKKETEEKETGEKKTGEVPSAEEERKEEEREEKTKEKGGGKGGEEDGEGTEIKHIVHYARQLQGNRIPYFEWNYETENENGKTDGHAYMFLLDGKNYRTGTRIKKEGMHTLCIRAVGATGMQTFAETVFYIDNTPPRIEISGTEKKEGYTENTPLDVSVSGKDEYLREVCINEKKAKIDAGAQMFHREFWEPGDYCVEILAEDGAGNQSKRKIMFSVEERIGARWLHRIFDKKVWAVLLLTCLFQAVVYALKKRNARR